MSVTKPSVISLFSGAGGLDIGLERAGWEVATATDNSPAAMRTLRASKESEIRIAGRRSNHLAHTRLVEADVRDLSAADLRPVGSRPGWRPDLVVGGPPCQPWSSAGLQRGLEDPRGQLIAHYLRLIGELSPRFVVFENVRGLVTAKGETGTPGEVLQSIQDDLGGMGYATRVATINAADFGAAQRRVRLLLVGTRDHALPEFPSPTHSRFGEAGTKKWLSLEQVMNTWPSPNEADVVRPSGAREAALRALTPGTGIKTGGRVMANRPSGQWGYRQDAFLADLSLPARTVRAAGTPDWVRPGAEGFDMRRLTWRECAALQGFPANWDFQGSIAQKFQQIGNAVQTDVAAAVGLAVRESWMRGEVHDDPVTPPWPADLLGRVRYTKAEHRVNGHLRVRQVAASSVA